MYLMLIKNLSSAKNQLLTWLTRYIKLSHLILFGNENFCTTSYRYIIMLNIFLLLLVLSPRFFRWPLEFGENKCMPFILITSNVCSSIKLAICYLVHHIRISVAKNFTWVTKIIFCIVHFKVIPKIVLRGAIQI